MFSKKIPTRFYFKQLGLASGIFFISIIIFLTTFNNISNKFTNNYLFWFSFLSGFLWVIGQLFQFIYYNRAPLSFVAPFSCASSLILTFIFSLSLDETSVNNIHHIIFSLISIGFILVGVFLMGYSQKEETSKTKNYKKYNVWITILIIVISSIFFQGLYIFPQLILKIQPSLPSDITTQFSQIFPTGLGMFVGSLICCFTIWIILAIKHKNHKRMYNPLLSKSTYLYIFVGFVHLSGTICNLFSVTYNGSVVANLFSQFSTVVSLFSGIFILKEKKNFSEWIFIISGLIIMITSLFLINAF